MVKYRSNKPIVLNFCTTDYSKLSTFVEEELEETNLVLRKFCRKYRLSVGQVVPVYTGEDYLVLNAVISAPGRGSSLKILKTILDNIKEQDKNGLVKFFKAEIHIHQKISQKAIKLIQEELSNFKILDLS